MGSVFVDPWSFRTSNNMEVMWSIMITGKEAGAPSIGLSTALQGSVGRAVLWQDLEGNIRRIDFLPWCVCHERSWQY